ncbi:hypothetical protein V1281_003079 [Nitrobacteraceae bacterium AZCC 2161]
MRRIAGSYQASMPEIIVPRMQRNALRLQRGALLIRGPGFRDEESGIPDLRSGIRTPQRVRETGTRFD